MNQTYQNRSVLITGHTGFKGSWLTQWLLMLGANVSGVSIDIPTTPSLFEQLKLKDEISDYQCNVQDQHQLQKIINHVKPEIIFHLAAQPIVKESIQDPTNTILTNAVGTMNLLESVRTGHQPQAIVCITSDKAYKNKNWPHGYRENDELGGTDPYSASKACAELIIHSYIESYFKNSGPAIASARAGNVIGGGDWTKTRIVPDAIMAWQNKQSVEVRNPRATRPWQHVLEPLSGYLVLGQNLLNNRQAHGQSYNFGPKQTVNQSVQKVLEILATYFEQAKWHIGEDPIAKQEHSLLKLSCDKALSQLNWTATLEFEQAIEWTAKWYQQTLNEPQTIKQITKHQIETYQEYAKIRTNQLTSVR